MSACLTGLGDQNEGCSTHHVTIAVLASEQSYIQVVQKGVIEGPEVGLGHGHGEGLPHKAAG